MRFGRGKKQEPAGEQGQNGGAQPAGPPSPQVEPLNDAEVAWVQTQLATAAVLSERYAGSGASQPTLAQLDATVTGWLADDESRVDVNTLVNAVGIAFGEHLAATTGLSWVMATDAYGTDLALHGQPGDVLVFPANAVAKRVTAGESGFVVALHDAMARDVKGLLGSA